MNTLDRIRELEDRVDGHDCHLGPEDGCDCILWQEEIAKLKVDANHEHYLGQVREFVEKNLIAKRKLEGDKGRNWNDIWNDPKEDKGELSSYSRILGLGCVMCGQSVTWANLQFFGWSIEKVKCYECQNIK